MERYIDEITRSGSSRLPNNLPSETPARAVASTMRPSLTPSLQPTQATLTPSVAPAPSFAPSGVPSRAPSATTPSATTTPFAATTASSRVRSVLPPNLENEVVVNAETKVSTTIFTLPVIVGLSLFFVLLAGGLTTLFLILGIKNKKKKNTVSYMPINNVRKPLFPVPSLNVATNSQDILSKDSVPDSEDPHMTPKRKNERDMFPDLSDADNTAEGEFAKQYSYENIHDSMFNRPRAKPSFSKLGGTSENWESDVTLLKKEIEKSGDTLDQFMDKTMAPIPEALADAWKASSYMPKKRYETKDNVPKYAQKEMPQLISDATQSIPVDGKDMAYTSMEEILRAKKRAKVLGVELPKLSQEQLKSIEKWSSSNEKMLSSLANSLKGIL